MDRQKSNSFIFLVLFDQGLKQLELQSSSIGSMEAKTGYLMTGEGVVLTILATFVTQSKNFVLNQGIVAGIMLLFISLFCCIFALWNRNLKVGIGIKDFYTAYFSNMEDQIRLKALNIVNYDYEVNRDTIARKAGCFQAALVTFGLSLLFLVSGLLYNYYSWYTASNMTQFKPTSTQHPHVQPNYNNEKHQTSVNNNSTFRWSSPSQSLGTIAADITKSKQDIVNK